MDDLRKRLAFTLAEVLIVLGIIGLIAEMTIPTLMADFQKQMQIVGLKKAYSEINQAVVQMAIAGGCPIDLSCNDVFNNTSGDPFVATTKTGNEFKKYFKLAKDCGATEETNPPPEPCFSPTTSYYFDGSGGRSFAACMFYSFTTVDGFNIMVDGNGFCVDKSPDHTNYNTNQVCGSVYVDVNGFKKPNNMGRDIFEFYITNGKGPAIYPRGGSELLDSPSDWSWSDSSGTPQLCTPSKPYGWYCAARIMEQGWQMKY